MTTCTRVDMVEDVIVPTCHELAEYRIVAACPSGHGSGGRDLCEDHMLESCLSITGAGLFCYVCLVLGRPNVPVQLLSTTRLTTVNA